jgi:hypothetical protein
MTLSSATTKLFLEIGRKEPPKGGRCAHPPLQAEITPQWLEIKQDISAAVRGML